MVHASLTPCVWKKIFTYVEPEVKPVAVVETPPVLGLRPIDPGFNLGAAITRYFRPKIDETLSEGT